MTDQTPEKTDKAVSDKPKRYAAYDTDYLKFVGGVHDTREKARKAAKDAGVKNLEIREV